jgi:hypothetical protein
MQTVADATANASQVYESLSDKILYDMKTHQIDLGPPSITDKIYVFFTFLNPIISLLALIGTLYLYCRWRTVAMALALFSAPHGGHSAKLRKRIWDAKTAMMSVTSNPFQLPPLQSIEIHDDTFRASIIAIVTLILLCLLLRPLIRCCSQYIARYYNTRSIKAPRKSPVFHLTLDIGDEHSRFSFNLVEIPFTPDQYHISATSKLSDIRISGYCYPTLCINWPELSIIHKYVPFRYAINERINISVREAYRLRQLIKRPHFLLSHIQSAKGHLELITITDTAPTTHSPPAVAALNIIPRIHASLHDLTRHLGSALTDSMSLTRGRSSSASRHLSPASRRASQSLYPSIPSAPIDNTSTHTDRP